MATPFAGRRRRRSPVRARRRRSGGRSSSVRRGWRRCGVAGASPSLAVGQRTVPSSGLDLGRFPVKRALFERGARLARPSAVAWTRSRPGSRQVSAAPSRCSGGEHKVQERFAVGPYQCGSRTYRTYAHAAGRCPHRRAPGQGRGQDRRSRRLGCCLGVLGATRTAPRRKRPGPCFAPAGSWSGGGTPTLRERVQGVRAGAARPRSGLVSVRVANSRAVRRALSGPPGDLDPQTGTRAPAILSPYARCIDRMRRRSAPRPRERPLPPPSRPPEVPRVRASPASRRRTQRPVAR